MKDRSLLFCRLAGVMMILLAVCVVSSCSDSSVVSQSPQNLKTLKDMPTDQLRVFLKGYPGDWRNDSDKAKGVEPPPIQKSYSKDAEIIDLVRPENIKLGSFPLKKAVNQRRSRREYTAESLTNEELSFLLWNTQGISKIVNDEGKQSAQYRTVPSGGGRHPFETYLIINRVEGVKQGLYRFLPVEHKLLLVRDDNNFSELINRACYGQNFIGSSAVVFIWAAVPYRTEWKYTYIAHKMIAIEAGHICQNLYLSAESISAGACAALGYDQASLDGIIGVNGKDEFAVYLAAVGKVKQENGN